VRTGMIQASDAVFEALEGDARNVLCEAVERHGAEMLVVGSHGYGAIKRSVPSDLIHCLFSLLFSSPLFPDYRVAAIFIRHWLQRLPLTKF
jgi:hypothetical protein